MWSSVDLPAPLGPSNPVMPGPSVTVMAFTATTLPYQRDASRSSICAAVTLRPSDSEGAAR